MRRPWLALMLSLIVACGAVPSAVREASTSTVSGPVTTIEEPTTTSVTGATALEATCGAVVVPVAEPLVLPDQPLDEDARSALEALAAVGAEPFFFDDYEWFIAARTESRLVLFGRRPGETNQGDTEFADASFVMEDGTWKPEGWGQCRVVVSAPGYGNASWATDPLSAPDPGSSEVAIQIMERNCASGEPPEGREILPVVAIAPDRVTITVIVEPVSGVANCPGNPWYPVVVDLGEPLGERALYDGSTLPAVERIWPPPENPVNG